MAQILVRDLDDALVEELKARAADNNRSLQGEVKAILEDAAERRRARIRFREEMDAYAKEFFTGAKEPPPTTLDDLRELRGDD